MLDDNYDDNEMFVMITILMITLIVVQPWEAVKMIVTIYQ